MLWEARQLTNAAGSVTDSYEYDAFGNEVNSTGTTPNNYLYRGEQYDPDLGLSHPIDNLITLNKPTLEGDSYQPGRNIGNFYNISAVGDLIQAFGSDSYANWPYDSHAVNHFVDTRSSSIRPHAALIWDDQFRNMWWQWFQNQQQKGPCARTAAVDSQGNGTGWSGCQ